MFGHPDITPNLWTFMKLRWRKRKTLLKKTKMQNITSISLAYSIRLPLSTLFRRRPHLYHATIETPHALLGKSFCLLPPLPPHRS